MDPKDLKRLYDQKKAEKAAKIAQATAASTKVADERKQRAVDAKAAINNVVLPYLTEVAASFDSGEFVFQTASVDQSDSSPVAVWFKIGSSRQYVIDVTGGNVRVGTRNVMAKGIASVLLEFVIPATEEPFIGKITDLTREKMGKLIQIAIAES
jgi:hypothetical protein